MTQRVLIVGTGLIGGSVGLALRKAGDSFVSGYDVDEHNASAALAAGALDEAVTDPTGADAAVVVVATPVGEVLPSIERLAPTLPPGTLVTDVGSTKAAIVLHAERLLGPERPFVGGHPMAGTEGEGVASARPDLFDGALWILTPTERTDPSAYRRINSLVTGMGAQTLALDPTEHDRLVALVSHLPYAIATALMAVAGSEGDPRVFRAAAGTFRDVTRTAGTSPRVWRDIFATNGQAILRELDQFSAMLDRMRAAVASERWDEIDAIVEEARAARKRFPLKGERAPTEPITLEVSIPDRAGVLAEITTAIGGGGINIEDLWVDHTPAGGVLRVMLDGRDTADRAAELLAARGFRTTTVEDQ